MTGSRGQMILVGAVIFAAAILLSVALVNTLHVPADLNTEQSTRSIESAETVAPQVRADLERLFLVHTSVAETGERVPYAREASGPDPPLEGVAANYNTVNADLTMADASRVVSVEYLNSTVGSVNGTLVRHNDSARDFTYEGFSSTTDGEWEVIDDAGRVAVFALNVTGENEAGLGIRDGETFEVEVGTSTVSFREETVLVNGSTVLGPADHDDLYPVELELVDGVGAVANATNRSALALDAGEGEVRFHNGNETTGTYTITGTGDGVTSELIGNEDDGAQYTRTDVVVNPKFRLTYTDASLTYDATFALYNGTGP